MSEMLIQEDPTLAAKRRMATLMMQQGQTPIQSGHPLEALLRAFQTGYGIYSDKKATDDAKAERSAGEKALADAVMGAKDLKSERGIQYSPGDFQGESFDHAAIAAAPDASATQKRGAMLDAMMASPNESVRGMGGRMKLQMALADPPEQFITVTGEEAKKRGGDPGGVYTVSTKTGKMEQVTPPDRSNQVLSPDVLAQRKEIASASAPRMTVDQRQDNAEGVEYGKTLVNSFNNIASRADTARRERNNLVMARGIKDLESGSFEPVKAKVSAVAQGLGFSEAQLKSLGLDQATSAEAFNGIMQNVVLTKMQAQKGPQTENDAKRIEQTAANLGHTPQARDFLMRAALETNARDIMQEEFYLDWRTKHKTFDGAQKSWNDYMANVPMVSENPTSKLPVFFSEFVEKAKEATVAAGNPEPSFDDLLNLWKEKYAGRTQNH